MTSIDLGSFGLVKSELKGWNESGQQAFPIKSTLISETGEEIHKWLSKPTLDHHLFTVASSSGSTNAAPDYVMVHKDVEDCEGTNQASADNAGVTVFSSKSGDDESRVFNAIHYPNVNVVQHKRNWLKGLKPPLKLNFSPGTGASTVPDDCMWLAHAPGSAQSRDIPPSRFDTDDSRNRLSEDQSKLGEYGHHLFLDEGHGEEDVRSFLPLDSQSTGVVSQGSMKS